jgi:hypothetical protein
MPDKKNFLELSQELIEGGSHYAAFILLYITMEMQFRKLFTFIVRIVPHSIHWSHIRDFLVKNDFNSGAFINLFDRFSETKTFREIIADVTRGGKNEINNKLKLIRQMERFRNKLFHGVYIYQPEFSDVNIQEYNRILSDWISTVQKAMQDAIGYDGLGSIKGNPKVKRIYKYNKNQKTEARQYLNNHNLKKTR